jgi:hypothetical protein
MKLGQSINVRLSKEVREQLETLAARHGVKAAVIIRQAIVEKLDEVEREAALVLPGPQGGRGQGGAAVKGKAKAKAK